MDKAVFLASLVRLDIALVGSSGAVRAAVTKLQAELKGSNEMPPNTSTASGKAEATFDADTKALTFRPPILV